MFSTLPFLPSDATSSGDVLWLGVCERFASPSTQNDLCLQLSISVTQGSLSLCYWVADKPNTLEKPKERDRARRTPGILFLLILWVAPLAWAYFDGRWGNQTVAALFSYPKLRMPFSALAEGRVQALIIWEP
jgi:hypothetical protein